MRLYKKYKHKSPQGGEAGFTLIEMIIVMVLASILGIFLLQIVTKSLSAQIAMQKRKEMADDAVLVLERISREVREAKEVTVPVDASSSNTSTLTFEKNVTPSEHVKYMLVLDSDIYKIMRYSATLASGLSSATGNVVAENVDSFTVTKESGGGGSDRIDIGLTFDEGSEWQTQVFPRNYGL
jgi:prepilin-type N-terminal cleavage/methylation domain-containing protein